MEKEQMVSANGQNVPISEWQKSIDKRIANGEEIPEFQEKKPAEQPKEEAVNVNAVIAKIKKAKHPGEAIAIGAPYREPAIADAVTEFCANFNNTAKSPNLDKTEEEE